MIIYKITNLVNGKIYIGQTVQKLKLRFYQHSVIAKNTKNSLITRSIIKYGKDNFKAEVIEVCKNTNELNDREIYWIKELNSLHPNGYNLSKGGGNREGFSNETVKKMSEYAVGRNRKRKSFKNSTSKFKGVSWSNKNKKWVSQIKFGDKRIYLGDFKNEIDAAKEYDLFCIKNGLYDNYLNFPNYFDFYKNLPDNFTFKEKTRMQYDLIGDEYGKLKVISFAGSIRQNNGLKQKVWLCRCICGNEIEVNTSKLKAGYRKSCGC